MKIIAFIMGFLVLLLSIMPCADKGINSSNSKVNTGLSQSNKHNDNPHQDDCSPFCHCTCCAGFSINHFITSLSYLTPRKSKAVSAYLPAGVIEIALPIWQPPKLV